jgi:acyl transferase domain-containing protein
VNACVILEEMAAREVPIDAAPVSEQLFVLSARTPSQLREYAARLRAFLCREPGVDLRALCYTLQVGREAMRERLAIVVSRHSELLDKLDDRLWSSAGKEGLYVGTASTATKAPTEAEKSLEILAERWVHGVAADWESLYEVEPGRLSLPTYPFSKERFWVSDTPLAEVRPTMEHRSSALHPLVSNNSSTLTDVSFSSRLSDTAFYAADHRVNGEKIFPGAGFLEIAGICGSLAAEQNVCKIRDIVWMNPLSFQGGPQTLRTHLKRIGDDVEYAITSLGDDNEPLVHTEGRLAFLRDGDGAGSVEKTLPLARLRELCSEFRTGDDLYSSLAAQGFVYGAGLRVVRELQTSESSVLARLQLPESLRAEFGEFLLHPALIDGALQTVAALLSTARPHRSYLPFALDEIDIVRPMTQACYAFVEDLQAGKTGNAPTRRFNVTLVDDLGDVLVSLRNLHMMPLDEIAMGHGQPAML